MSNAEHVQRLDGGRLGSDAVFLGEAAITGITMACLTLLWYAGWLPALAAAASATFAVCAVTWPRAFRIASYAAVVALPFASAWPALRADAYSYPVYLAALLLALVGLGAFQARMFTASLGALYLAYVAVAATIVVAAQHDTAGATGLAYVLMAFALYTLVRRSDAAERRLVVAMVLLLGSVESIVAVAQTLLGWPVFELVLPSLTQSDRNYFAYVLPGVGRSVTQASGTFGHFNALGALLSLCLPLAFGVWLGRRRSPWRVAALVAIAAGLTATFSRGALLGASAGVLFALWFGLNRSRRATIALVACLAILASSLAANVVTQYVLTTNNLTVRLHTWRLAFDDALELPSSLIAGCGLGHFHAEVLGAGLGSESLTQQSSYMASLHSGYVQLLLEFGLIATMLFVLWMISLYRRAATPATPLVIPALGGALGLLCSQAFDNALFSYCGVVLAALLAVAEGESQSHLPFVQVPPSKSELPPT